MIVAITVTYNRTRTLRKTLKALFDQRRLPDKVVVVDNGSSSDELKVLKSFEQEYGSRLDIVYLNENRGGAGGFEAGMKYALEKYNPDWFWIMDDDAYPRNNCLEELLKHDDLPEIGCLCPLAYGIDLNKYQLFHHKMIDRETLKETPYASDVNQLKEVNRIDANAFVGPLISRKAVEKCGVADGGLFIYGDDTEYTYRVRHSGFSNYLIKSAVIDHQDLLNKGNVLDPALLWKEYYMVRNTFLFIKEFASDEKQKKHLLSRQKLSIFKSILATYIKGGYRGFRKIRTDELKRAVSDGLGGHKGKTIDPQEFRNMIAKRKEEMKK